jgi:carboxylesterase type B
MTVSHGSELPYVFGGPVWIQTGPSTPSAQALSNQMMDYWISFVVSMNPNDGKGLESKSLLLLETIRS